MARVTDLSKRSVGGFLSQAVEPGSTVVTDGLRVFRGLDGFRNLPLFEDLDLSRRMRQVGKTVLLLPAVRTSGRRFLQGGMRHSLWRILRLKLRYAMGSDLRRLAQDYWSDGSGGSPAQGGS